MFSSDYEFLCRVYRLSGACTFPDKSWSTFQVNTTAYGGLITSGRLKEPLAQRGRFPERSLESLTSDHSQFVSSAADIRNAKNYNNVIEEYFFDIPLEYVGEYAINIITYTVISIFYA